MTKYVIKFFSAYNPSSRLVHYIMAVSGLVHCGFFPLLSGKSLGITWGLEKKPILLVYGLCRVCFSVINGSFLFMMIARLLCTGGYKGENPTEMA